MVQPPMMAPPYQVMAVQVGGAMMPGQDPLLEGLAAFPGLLVRQKKHDWCSAVCCPLLYPNQYSIYNPWGPNGTREHILQAYEESACMARCCFHARRGLDVHIKTADDREVLHIDRPFRLFRKGGLFCCCSDMFFQVVDVYAGRDTLHPRARLGHIRENFSWCKPYLTIFDGEGNEQYRIVGDWCGCANYTLRIFRAHEENQIKENQIGRIQNRWSGLAKELLTQLDNFVIEFPVDANYVQRALLLAATIFIDYLYFERKKEDNNNNL